MMEEEEEENCRLKLRSRMGCLRCRKRRQKCGEQRPQCMRCIEASEACEYTAPRPDGRRAKTGQDCLVASKLAISVPKASIPRITCLLLGSSAFRHPAHGIYLDYFIQKASGAIACHDSIQRDTCHMIVSVASVFPCVLYSALLFSAMHKSSMVQDSSTNACAIPLLQLNALTLAMLRKELEGGSNDYRAIAATSLMLATAELRYNPEGSAWRMHFNSAKQLFTLAGPDQPDDAISRFISRRMAILQFLVAIPTPWSMTQPTSSCEAAALDLPPPWPVIEPVGVIDSTLACVQEVLQVFEWIRHLSTVQKSLASLDMDFLDFEVSTTRSYISSVAVKLVKLIINTMKRDQHTPPVLSDDIRSSCDGSQVDEYRICNSIAQHMSLICIYRYNLQLSRDSPVISQSVAKIIELAKSMSHYKGSHPYLCLTTALFVAGCEAEMDQTTEIRNLLQTHYNVTKSQSTHKSIRLLETLWQERTTDNGITNPVITCKFMPFNRYTWVDTKTI